MDDYNNKQNGELRGFDEVTNENGYTVTPDGGFYTKSREDIIQDEAFKSPEQPDNAARAEDTPQAEQEARQTYADSGANYSRNNNYNYGGTTFYARPPKQKKNKKKGAFKERGRQGRRFDICQISTTACLLRYQKRTSGNLGAGTVYR